MSSNTSEFTGRHMLAIMLAFFGVIIGVNATMAWFAGSSWTGFVVRNSYIASQEFNGRVAAAREQRALGWTAALDVRSGVASLSLADRDGRPVAIERARVEFKSPADESNDRLVELLAGAGQFQGAVDAADGVWVVAIMIETPDGAQWKDTRRVMLRGGSMR